MYRQLFHSQGFSDYLACLTLGALNDNVFKNVLALFLIYQASSEMGEGRIWVNVSAGLFILPFFLFSALAGQLADRYPKALLIQWVKLGEILIMIFGALGFALGEPVLLLITLFLMGSQSAFFGPVKYSLMPQYLPPELLAAGNAVVESATFLAILIGTLFASLIMGFDLFPNLAIACVLILAVLGYLAARQVPFLRATDLELTLDLNPFRSTWMNLKQLFALPKLMPYAIGISWFWFLGALILTQLPAFTRWHLGGGELATGFLLLIFSIGIAIGALMCAAFSRSSPIEKLLLPGASILGFCLLDFAWASPGQSVNSMPFSQFLSTPIHWRLFADLLGLSIGAGLFTVPLYTRLQQLSDPKQVSRIIAGNNILNAGFMVAAAIFALLLQQFSLGMKALFFSTVGLHFVLTFWLWLKRP